MKRWLVYGAAAAGLLLCLGGCGGPSVEGIQEPSALPAVETPAPTPTPTPTSTPTPPPTPTPTPTLTPMERKYSDFDPSGAELEFEILDEPGIPQDKGNAESVLVEYLYGTWYWEGTDTPFTIDEETIDGRAYYIHAVKECPDAEAVAALLTYADEPEMGYQLETYAYSTDPYIRKVEINSIGDGPVGYISVGLEYSESELDQIYAEYEEEYGSYEEEYGGYEEQEPTVPDGTVAYFRFMTEVGEYEVENGEYVLQQAWTWTNNEVVKWDNTGRPTVRTSNNRLPPVEVSVSWFLPKSFSASDCPYESCPASTVSSSYSEVMFSTRDNS